VLQPGKNSLTLDEIFRQHTMLIGETRFTRAGRRPDGVFLGEREPEGNTTLGDDVMLDPILLIALSGISIGFPGHERIYTRRLPVPQSFEVCFQGKTRSCQPGLDHI
jgi:hypothetical protein